VDARHAIVLGSDRLGLRIGQQLERDGYGVAIITPPGSWLAEAPVPERWQVIRVRPDQPGVLAEAGLARADAFLAVSDRDDLNLGAALLARELRPDVRLVLRQFNPRLAPLLTRHLGGATVQSLTALAAPSFAWAALSSGVVAALDLGDDMLVLREEPGTEAARAGTVVAGAIPGQVRFFDPAFASTAPRLLTAHAASSLTQRPVPPRVDPKQLSRPPEERETDQLMRFTLLTLLAVLLGVAAVFVTRLRLGYLDAVYFVSTILTTVGFGDFSLRDADAVSKAVGIGAMFAGLFLTALLVSLLTNRLLQRQEARRRGHYRQRLRGHVVVCGLGTLGVRIAVALQRLGVSVVGVDPSARPPLRALLRASGVPIVQADATDERTLLFANVPEARAIVVASSHDHLNVEIGLVARTLRDDLPVVLRLFDHDLGRRVAATFGFEPALSGATLGAGAFTAFADGDTRLLSLSFEGAGYEVHRLPGLGRTCGQVAAALGGHALALVAGGRALELQPGDNRQVAPDESLLVLVPERRREDA